VGAPAADPNGLTEAGSAYVFGSSLSLSASGACPGSMTFEIGGATPDGRVAIGGSFDLGSTTIPGGPCAGTEIGLSAPRLLATVTADAEGSYTVTTSVRAQTCGLYLQVVDFTSCEVSNVLQVPQ